MISLSNPGPMPALVDPPLVLGPEAPRFRVAGACATGTVLQAGQSCDYGLVYEAGMLASAEAILRVRTDQGLPQSVLLRGSGVAGALPPAPTKVLPPSAGGGC